MKSLSRRGQAFIVFDKITSATDAIEKLQGFLLFGKKLVRGYLFFLANISAVLKLFMLLIMLPYLQRLNYAKGDSDVVAKAKGTFTPRVKKPLPPKRLPKRKHESDEENGSMIFRSIVDEIASFPWSMQCFYQLYYRFRQ